MALQSGRLEPLAEQVGEHIDGTNAIGSATSTAASLWVDVDGNGVGDGWETSVLAWGLESADSQQTVPVNLEKAVAIVAGNGFSVVL